MQRGDFGWIADPMAVGCTVNHSLTKPKTIKKLKMHLRKFWT